MNPHPNPRKPIHILHVTSCWLEKLEIFIVIDSRTPYLVSCHAPTGQLGRLSPYSMSVENRQKIQDAVDRLVSDQEIELPVHWCCADGSADVIGRGAPLDSRHFMIGDPAKISQDARTTIRELTSHRIAAQRQRTHPSVSVSRIKLKPA